MTGERLLANTVAISTFLQPLNAVHYEQQTLPQTSAIMNTPMQYPACNSIMPQDWAASLLVCARLSATVTAVNVRKNQQTLLTLNYLLSLWLCYLSVTQSLEKTLQYHRVMPHVACHLVFDTLSRWDDRCSSGRYELESCDPTQQVLNCQWSVLRHS